MACRRFEKSLRQLLLRASACGPFADCEAEAWRIDSGDLLKEGLTRNASFDPAVAAVSTDEKST
jgi:hypothetical protein